MDREDIRQMIFFSLLGYILPFIGLWSLGGFELAVKTMGVPVIIMLLLFREPIMSYIRKKWLIEVEKRKEKNKNDSRIDKGGKRSN